MNKYPCSLYMFKEVQTKSGTFRSAFYESGYVGYYETVVIFCDNAKIRRDGREMIISDLRVRACTY